MKKVIKFTILWLLLTFVFILKPEEYNPYNSVGIISAYAEDGGGIAGTVFAVDREYLLSAGHVCEAILKIKTDDIYIYYLDKNSIIKAVEDIEVVAISEEEDLCLLKAHNHGLLPVRFSHTPLKIRDDILAIGAPDGMAVGEYSGKVMDLYMDYGGTNKILTSNASVGGMSGGPIFNSDKKVVGVLVATVVKFNQASFCVPLAAIKKFIREVGL